MTTQLHGGAPIGTLTHSVDSMLMFAEIEALWPIDEQGQSLDEADVDKPALAREVRAGTERLVGAALPAVVAVRLLNTYLSCRRQYRRPESTGQDEDNRIIETIETLASSSPYAWGPDVLEVI